MGSDPHSASLRYTNSVSTVRYVVQHRFGGNTVWWDHFPHAYDTPEEAFAAMEEGSPYTNRPLRVVERVDRPVEPIGGPE